MSYWTQSVDLYCERTSDLFWAEPINAISNLSIFLSGFIIFAILIKKQKVALNWPTFLSSMAMVIGTGSFLFHTFGNKWSFWADVIPILIFMFSFFTFILKKYFNFSSLTAVCGGLAFVALSRALGHSSLEIYLNGSLPYLPSWLFTFVFGVLGYKHHKHLSKRILQASFYFALSLFARSIDMSICPSFPIGTHFIWHILNGLVLFFLMTTSLPSEQNDAP